MERDTPSARKANLKAGLASNPIRIGTFTDPNDLLSYRLNEYAIPYTDVLVTNVIVSNAPAYLEIVQRPDYAHYGYGLESIRDGYDSLWL